MQLACVCDGDLVGKLQVVQLNEGIVHVTLYILDNSQSKYTIFLINCLYCLFLGQLCIPELIIAELSGYNWDCLVKFLDLHFTSLSASRYRLLPVLLSLQNVMYGVTEP